MVNEYPERVKRWKDIVEDRYPKADVVIPSENPNMVLFHVPPRPIDIHGSGLAVWCNDPNFRRGSCTFGGDIVIDPLRLEEFENVLDKYNCEIIDVHEYPQEYHVHVGHDVCRSSINVIDDILSDVKEYMED